MDKITTSEWMLSKSDTRPVGFRTTLHKSDRSIEVAMDSERIVRVFNPARNQFQIQAIRIWHQVAQ